ncbi:MAG: hypothetical protein AAGC60_26960 [Acidobacteriota bacterium]
MTRTPLRVRGLGALAALVVLCLPGMAVSQPAATSAVASVVTTEAEASCGIERSVSRSGAMRPVDWRTARYKASKLFLTARTEVVLAPLPPPQARAQLQACPGQCVEGLAPHGATWAISFDASFVGRRSTETVHFDAADGRSLQRVKRRHGSDAYAKLYRFAEQGVAYRRSSPATESEKDLEPPRWTKGHTDWIGEPADAAGCPVVSPAALFYLLSAYPWDRGDGFELCVFTNKAYSRLAARKVGTERHQPRGDVAAALGLGDAPIEALQVDLVASTFDGSDPTEKFELMGLEGDIRMLLDPRTGIPLQFRGDLSSLGSVEVTLERVGFE